MPETTVIKDYEAVSTYPLDPDKLEELLSTHRELVFMWGTKDGWPVGVIMSYLWARGRFWVTMGAHRHRVAAIRRDPRVSVCVTSTGTPLGGGKTVTAKGRAVIHEDRATKDWFYTAFANHLNPDPAAAKAFVAMLDSPVRIVVEVIPEKWITYDGAKMFADAAGQLPPEAKGPRLSSDAERLPAELKRRGLL